MYYRRSRSSDLGEGQSVKTLSGRRIITLVYEIWVAESNGSEVANGSLWACAECSINKKLCYREEHSASVVLSWCTL